MLNISLLKNCIIKPPLQMPNRFVNIRSTVNPYEFKYKPEPFKDSFEFIAKGAQGSVYRILNTNYAIKVKNNADLKRVFSKPLNLNISESDRINHIKAKIGDDIEIMYFVPGEQIKNQFTQREFKQEKITDYLKYIYNASLNNMRHDIGGKNTLFDKATGQLTPIDFYPNKPGYKHFIINDAFIQLYGSTKNAKEAESLLSKITVSFLELLKTDAINKKGLCNIDTGLKTLKDITLTNPQYKDAQLFVYALEKRLKDIIQQKNMIGIFPDAQKTLLTQIEKLEQELQRKII